MLLLLWVMALVLCFVLALALCIVPNVERQQMYRSHFSHSGPDIQIAELVIALAKGGGLFEFRTPPPPPAPSRPLKVFEPVLL